MIPTKFEELFHNNQPDQQPSTSTYKYWIPQSRQEEIPGVRERNPRSEWGHNDKCGTMTSATPGDTMTSGLHTCAMIKMTDGTSQPRMNEPRCRRRCRSSMKPLEPTLYQSYYRVYQREVHNEKATGISVETAAGRHPWGCLRTAHSCGHEGSRMYGYPISVETAAGRRPTMSTNRT